MKRPIHIRPIPTRARSMDIKTIPKTPPHAPSRSSRATKTPAPPFPKSRISQAANLRANICHLQVLYNPWNDQ